MHKLRDLGLSYEEALHGMQTAVLHEMNLKEKGDHRRSEVIRTDLIYPNGPKHLRVGVNSAMSDMLAIVTLLIDKGIITEEEYVERVRLAMNEELARYEDKHPRVKFR